MLHILGIFSPIAPSLGGPAGFLVVVMLPFRGTIGLLKVGKLNYMGTLTSTGLLVGSGVMFKEPIPAYFFYTSGDITTFSDPEDF